jgi:hypothetical protein
MLNFADCVNLAAAAGFDGSAGRTHYDEKEQSTDSTATDVEKDFNGRGRESCVRGNRPRSRALSPRK